jgi:hypothetical protein
MDHGLRDGHHAQADHTRARTRTRKLHYSILSKMVHTKTDTRHTNAMARTGITEGCNRTFEIESGPKWPKPKPCSGRGRKVCAFEAIPPSRRIGASPMG